MNPQLGPDYSPTGQLYFFTLESSNPRYDVMELKTLQDWFERITDSERAFLELDRVVKHDRLGVHQAMLQIVDLWDNRRLLATPTWLPLLDRVAQNEAFINMARERAAYVAAGIRASGKSE